MVKKFGAGARFSNAAKALTAFILHYTKPIKLNKDTQSELNVENATCMEIIEDFCGIN